MATAELRSKRILEEPMNDLEDFVRGWLRVTGQEMFRSCATCQHARKDGPMQCQKYMMVPPVAVIVAGCETYYDTALPPMSLDEEIPF